MRPRILGAFIVGAGLIAFAYYFAPEGTSGTTTADARLNVVTAEAPARGAIDVTDDNLDGIPDWREPFEQIENPLGLDDARAASYTPPDTLTEQVGIDVFQRALQLKTEGALNTDGPNLISSAVTDVAQSAEDRIYAERDITITPGGELSESAERAYFNTVGEIISNGPTVTRNEAIVLEEALTANDPARIDELAANEEFYKSIRDELLRLPAPAPYVKEHLDLINVANALYNDIAGMRLVFEDPLYALLRVKRYQDDASGLYYALQNYYFAMDDSPVSFTENDAAIVFTVFKP